jgi:predicted DNA-binding helix-hairpin-helix protein
MIVGADATDDAKVLETSSALYSDYKLRRVYYSAFSPHPAASAVLPLKAPPLQRENRLYQADWLLRFYGFSVAEIASGGEAGMLDLEIDPKLAWALKNRAHFPVDVNTADREWLLRVPGLGVRAVDRILRVRRHSKLRMGDLARLTTGTRRLRPFLITLDHHPLRLTDRSDLRGLIIGPAKQLDLF